MMKGFSFMDGENSVGVPFDMSIYNWLLLNSLQVISRKYGRSL